MVVHGNKDWLKAWDAKARDAKARDAKAWDAKTWDASPGVWSIEIELAVKCAQSIGKNKKKVPNLPSTIFLLTFFLTDTAILIPKSQLFSRYPFGVFKSTRKLMKFL